MEEKDNSKTKIIQSYYIKVWAKYSVDHSFEMEKD